MLAGLVRTVPVVVVGVLADHDVSEEDGWPAVIAAAERLGRLDIMVANAGIGIMGSAIVLDEMWPLIRQTSPARARRRGERFATPTAHPM